MASIFLDNIMRFGSDVHNMRLVVAAGTGTATLSPKTFDLTDHQADSPLLVRFEDLSTQDYIVAVPPVTIDAADTFGLPDNFSDPLPLYVGVLDNATAPLLVVSPVDTFGTITTTTTATTGLSNLSSSVATGKVKWFGKITGFTRTLGVYSFSNAKVVYDNR